MEPCFLSIRLVGWLFGFYGISTFVGLNNQIHFMKIVLFQTIQFSISTQFKCKNSLIVNFFLFQAIQFSRAVLIQLSISTDFVYTQLNVKTVLY